MFWFWTVEGCRLRCHAKTLTLVVGPYPVVHKVVVVHVVPVSDPVMSDAVAVAVPVPAHPVVGEVRPPSYSSSDPESPSGQTLHGLQVGPGCGGKDGTESGAR